MNSSIHIIKGIAVGLLLFLGGLLCAQPVNNVVGQISLPSPDVSAMGKFIDIPVTYYTGVPSINIPLTTAVEGPLQIPVGLTYHASGVKAQELASRVGLGWKLDAGGMISRTIQGKNDFSVYIS